MLRRRSIRSRILVLVLAPVVALVGLYAIVLNLTLGQYLTLRQASSARNEIARPVLRVQSALAAERGLSLEYLISPHHSHLLRMLLAQEGKTDAAVHQFDVASTSVLASSVDPKERTAISALRSDLTGLGRLRADVVGSGINLPGAASAYSSKVADGDSVLIQAILPLVTNTAGLAAASVSTLNASLQIMSEESDVLRAELTARVFPAADQQLISQLATVRQQLWTEAISNLDPKYQGYFSRMIPATATQDLQAMENSILDRISYGHFNGTIPPGGPPNPPAPKHTIVSLAKGHRTVTLRTWTTAEASYAAGFGKAVLASDNDLVAAASQDESTIFTRLLLAAGFGLLAIAIAIGVAVVVSRRLIRELDDLRLSALSLASKGLPDTIERLRAGEMVETEAPALLDSSPDEIGQVRLAFNTAARTAIQAAVEEIKIRRSVNDVFRNLARRNQSLLTRQLELLDAMERRVHDPEELADLFRIDHMTTRMRRHAEGLLIVAGSTSGRAWREPVPLIDVMRAAIAEVENYTRVRVSSHTSAALAGHAVADLIHLLAELVENATMFSPASTQVRIEGDKVARGLALEIEDRGLGMSEAKLAEMNAKLVDPPMFDLSVSDQLGLFIAGQLARRHDIKVTLRSSPYGGVTAVVLIPNSLVVDVDSDEQLASISIRELGGRPVPQLPGPAATPTWEDALATQGALTAYGASTAQGAIAAPLPRDAQGYGNAQGPDIAQHLDNVTDQGPVEAEDPIATLGTFSTHDQIAVPGNYPGSPPALGQFSTWSATATGSQETDLASQAWPTVPDSPAWPSAPGIADGNGTNGTNGESGDWTSIRVVSGADGKIGDWTSSVPGDWTQDRVGDIEDDLPQRRPGVTIAGWPSNGRDADATPDVATAEFISAQPDTDDLPVRVRQASLAPQLRASNPGHSHDHQDSSPETARNVMAAMQRGWERGRAAPDDEASTGQPIPDHLVPDHQRVPTTVRPTGGEQQ